jgi:hypothetical protein
MNFLVFHLIFEFPISQTVLACQFRRLFSAMPGYCQTHPMPALLRLQNPMIWLTYTILALPDSTSPTLVDSIIANASFSATSVNLGICCRGRRATLPLASFEMAVLRLLVALSQDDSLER